MYTTSICLLDQLRQQAEADVWGRFVELYTPLLHYWACQLPGMREEDALDLVQDLFLLLVQKLPEFEYQPGRSFRGWLRTLLLHRWCDTCRNEPVPAHLNEIEMERLLLPDHAEVISADEYRQYLVGRALQLMKSDFEPATWQACWDVVCLGRSAAEVAAELGLSVGAVYVAKSRILRRLRQELNGMLD
jgi:RNA polymerase sigma-70 factor (ECF subfamily)